MTTRLAVLAAATLSLLSTCGPVCERNADAIKVVTSGPAEPARAHHPGGAVEFLRPVSR